ncbi:hypothetical protein F8M41_020554 [Gigaspora margarita]|uniref:Uncharacterized protein n=1 Tax=Gigaspora margarita TaxID=4874 RepID=A0A8H4EU12_GIGMA|nr:hypothetical protein F8M41_020554 [Gigaspora margarita]
MLKEQASLIPFNIFIPNYSKPLFDYASYTTSSGNFLMAGIINWLDNEGLEIFVDYPCNETEIEFAIKYTLIKMFLRKNEKFNHLEIGGNVNMMLFEILRINNTIINLVLSLDNLTENIKGLLDYEVRKSFAVALSKNKTLTTLNFYGNCGMGTLKEIFHKNTTLKEFYYYGFGD